MPSFSYKALTKKLKKLGFSLARQASGSHEIWYNSETKVHFTIPKHHGDFKIGLVTKLAKHLGFKSLKDFQDFDKG